MKAGWEIKKLGDVCQVVGGGTPSKANDDFYKGKILWATVRDMKFDMLSETEHRITEQAIKSSATNIIPKGNVVIATRVGLGKVCLLENDTAINQDLRGVVPKYKGKLSEKYLFFWFKSIAHLIEQAGTGATVHGVKLPFVKSLEIPVPPLTEQRRIVAILDEAFAGIAAAKEKAEQNLKNAKEVFESYLEGIFAAPRADWETKKIGDICKSIGYGTSSKSQKEGKVPVLRMGNIQDGKLDWSDLVYSDNVGEIEKYALREGDVLFNRTNSAEHVGKTAIFRGERESIFAGYLIRINVKRSIVDPEFLTIYLNSGKIREYGYSVMTSSVNQANISGSKLKEYPFLMPPLHEQRQIVSDLHNISAETSSLESSYQQKLANLEELKKSVLQQAFSGAL